MRFPGPTHLVILSRGHAAEAREWTGKVMSRIGLTLNEAKTSVKDARRETFNFLGLHIRTYAALEGWQMVYGNQASR